MKQLQPAISSTTGVVSSGGGWDLQKTAVGRLVLIIHFHRLSKQVCFTGKWVGRQDGGKGPTHPPQIFSSCILLNACIHTSFPVNFGPISHQGGGLGACAHLYIGCLLVRRRQQPRRGELKSDIYILGLDCKSKANLFSLAVHSTQPRSYYIQKYFC